MRSKNPRGTISAGHTIVAACILMYTGFGAPAIAEEASVRSVTPERNFNVGSAVRTQAEPESDALPALPHLRRPPFPQQTFPRVEEQILERLVRPATGLDQPIFGPVGPPGSVQFEFGPGNGPPPTFLCDCLMKDFPEDNRPENTFVSDVVTPCGDVIRFPDDRPLVHFKSGSGWTGWSHGYTGDVYWSYFGNETTLTFPPNNIGRFYGYIAPTIGTQRYKFIVNGMFESSEIEVNGFANAAFFGICSDLPIETVRIVCTTNNDFAIGAFGICCFERGEVFGACCDPSSTVCNDNVDAYDCVAPLQHTPDTTCVDLPAVCGNPGACCDDVAGTCTTDVLEVNCDEPGQRFIPGGACQDFDPACGQITVDFDFGPGTGPPPGALCDVPMEPFPLDERNLGNLELSVPYPCPQVGGEITFSHPVEHRRVGVSWAAWSHGYMGDVYWTRPGRTEVTLTFPPGNNGQFYCYIAPEPDDTHTYQLIVNDAFESPPFLVDSFFKARYIGVCAFPEIETIRIVCTSGEDFAIGALGAGCLSPGESSGACCNPFTGSCTDNVDAFNCLPPFQFTADTLCADLTVPCGNAGACCDEIANTCNESVFELACQGVGKRFLPGGICSDFEPACGLLTAAFDTEPGTSAPPASIFGCPLTAFAPDDRPILSIVQDIDLPCAVPAKIEFDRPAFHLRVGDGWNTWSHGYTGDVYFTGTSEVTLRFPDEGITYGTFYCYVQPDATIDVDFKVIVNGVFESAEFTANGAGGATFVGVDAAPHIETITIVSTDNRNFAFGEFGVCCFGAGEYSGACCDPFEGSCQDGVDAVNCSPPLQFSLDTLCANLDTVCGNPGACCDEFNQVCNEGVLELNCDGGRRFLAGATCADFAPACGDDSGIRVVLDVGMNPPPPMLCDRNVQSLGTDNRPLFEEVSDFILPCTVPGTIQIDPPLFHAIVPFEPPQLGGWSHGYMGDTYLLFPAVFKEEYDITLTFPPGYDTFYGYIRADADVFAPDDQTFKIIVNGVFETEEFVIVKQTTRYFGICAEGIETIRIVNTSGELMTLGDLGIGCFGPGDVLGSCCDPATGICTNDVDLLNCASPLRFTRGVDCGDLDPPCGTPGACCDELAGTCTESVLALDCAEPGDRFLPGGVCADLDPPCGSVEVSFDFTPGTGEPPFNLCDCLPLDLDDTRPFFQDVSDVPITCPSGGVIGLDPSAAHFQGATVGWGGSANGNADAYSNFDGDRITLTFPPGYTNFSGYVSQRSGGPESFKLIVNGVFESAEFSVAELDEPGYFGVCTNSLDSITVISTSGAPFALGRFRICCDAQSFGACCDPFVGTCTDNVLASNCAPPSQFSLDTACIDLAPPCFNPGACCDELTGTCVDDVLAANCAGRFEPGVTCETLVPPCGAFTPCLTQAPTGVNAPQASDLDCDFCDTPIFITSEVFILHEPTALQYITVWGGYVPDNQPLQGNFTLVLREDNTGVPGDVLVEIGPMAPAFEKKTGLVFQDDIVEWQHTFDLSGENCVDLAPGIYWLVIYNDTSDSTDTWVWRRGSGDTAIPTGSVNRFGFITTLAEDVPWFVNSGRTFAMQFSCARCFAGPVCDVTRDGNVNSEDFEYFRAAFGSNDPVADIDLDGTVNWLDYIQFWSCYQEFGLQALMPAPNRRVQPVHHRRDQPIQSDSNANETIRSAP